ncbi:rRNA adenine N-6-methyltransferase family protein [Candidatus Vidania fulgoroideorum]
MKNRDYISIINRNKILEIVSNIKLTKKNIEIGSGRGEMTKEIIKIIGKRKLILIEINKKYTKVLRRKFPQKEVTIINKSILEVDIKKQGKFTVIGNIPYSISSKILKKLLNNIRYIKTQYIMIQEDIFKKINTLGCWQYYLYNSIYYIRSICKLEGRDFKPKVKVNSVFIEMRKRNTIDASNKEFITNNSKRLYKMIVEKIKLGCLSVKKYSEIKIEEYLFFSLAFRRKIKG